jgi:hypothetical protein
MELIPNVAIQGSVFKKNVILHNFGNVFLRKSRKTAIVEVFALSSLGNHQGRMSNAGEILR